MLLTFQTRVGGGRLKNKLVARVVYVILEAMEELISGSIGSFGVEFEEPPEQVKDKLPLLDNRKNEDQIRSTKLDLTQFCDHRNQFKPFQLLPPPPPRPGFHDLLHRNNGGGDIRESSPYSQFPTRSVTSSCIS